MSRLPTHRVNGTRVKRPDSRALAIPKRAFVRHGGGSALLRAAFDLRTRVGRLHKAQVAALCRHVGDPTLPQTRLIDHAVRLRLLAEIAWGEIQRGGAFSEHGDPRPAVNVYRKAAADERAVLALLGLERRVQPVPTLDQYITGAHA